MLHSIASASSVLSTGGRPRRAFPGSPSRAPETKPREHPSRLAASVTDNVFSLRWKTQHSNSYSCASVRPRQFTSPRRKVGARTRELALAFPMEATGKSPLEWRAWVSGGASGCDDAMNAAQASQEG